MIYTGFGARAVDSISEEPALLDPSLPVDWANPDHHGDLMDYWPSYSKLNPRSRAAYLAWLADGRRHPGAFIGYVFLFFYGIERRLLADLPRDLSGPEALALTEEVRRLLALYGDQGSFRWYATELLRFLETSQLAYADLQLPEDGAFPPSWEVPMLLQVAVGRFVAAGQPIPADWALSFLRHHPDAYLRTPAERCASEFDELFVSRYTTGFSERRALTRPAADLSASYRPASAGFDGLVTAEIGGIPDVTSSDGLIVGLRDLASMITDELDAYSRFLGRRPEERESADAAALLPDELLGTRAGPVVDGLRSWLHSQLGDADWVLVKLDDLVQRWSPGRVEKLKKRDAVSLASLLHKLDIAIEPDVRFGTSTPKPGIDVVLYRLPDEATAAPSASYRTAVAVVHLAAVVAAADGVVDSSERAHLATHLERVFDLDPSERVRLQAHLLFLEAGDLGMAGMKRRIEDLPVEQRSAVGQFLVGVAAADGVVSPEEIATLTKLYARLGLEEAEVYRQVHTLGSSDGGPVTVRGKGTPTRWAVPQPTADPEPRSGIVLDPEKVRARLAETAHVTALLADIFADDGQVKDEPLGNELSSRDRADAGPGETPSDANRVAGLDAPHSQLVTQLFLQTTWSRSDAEALSESLGQPFLNAALDRINEAAFEACGEPFAEGEDPIEINSYAAQEMEL